MSSPDQKARRLEAHSTIRMARSPHINCRCSRMNSAQGPQATPLRLDRPPAPVGHPHLNGWQGPLPRQHLYRASVAPPEIRVRARLEDRVSSPIGSREIDGVLQSPPPAQSLGGRPSAGVYSLKVEATQPDQSSKSARSCPSNEAHLKPSSGATFTTSSPASLGKSSSPVSCSRPSKRG